MQWIFFALLAPLLYAIGNISDKIVLEKHVQHVRAYFMFANLFYIVYFALLPFINLNIPLRIVILSFIAGAIHAVAIFFFYKSIMDEDVSTVIILLQSIPLVTLVLASAFVDEQLTSSQFAAFIIIILGSLLASLKNIRHFRLTPAALPIGITVILLSVSTVIQKSVYNQTSLMQGYAFYALGHLIVVPLLFSKTTRKTLVEELDRKKIMIFSAVSTLYLFANLTNSAAISLGPVSLVNTVGSFNSVFAFLLASYLSHFFPHVLRENIGKHTILRKTIAIFIMITGLSLLY